MNINLKAAPRMTRTRDLRPQASLTSLPLGQLTHIEKQVFYSAFLHDKLTNK